MALLVAWLRDAVVTVTRFRATCQQLRHFPLPPWRNWLLGHTGMVRGRGQGVALGVTAGTGRWHFWGDLGDQAVAIGVTVGREWWLLWGDRGDRTVAFGVVTAGTGRWHLE